MSGTGIGSRMGMHVEFPLQCDTKPISVVARVSRRIVTTTMSRPTRGSAREGASAPDVRPMLATAGATLPSDAGWAFEMKWDGVRALGFVSDGRLRLTSRNGNDLTPAYPELAGLADALGRTAVVLDGEIVALDDRGRASFQRLQQRMHVRDQVAATRLAATIPVAYMLFDVVWIDGQSLIAEPYTRRRAMLEAFRLGDPHWQVPPTSEDGRAALAASEHLGFEGVVAKRLDSRYEPGRRSRAWVKVKHQLRQEFVVGGWEPGQGSRHGRPGSLLLGYYDGTALRYAGKVGTGFTEAELGRLAGRLHAIERASSPFVDSGAVPRTARFAEPELVAEVRFSEWTVGGRIRQSAYLGLRDDKAPREVVREVSGASD